MGGFKVGGDSGSWPWPHRSLSEQLNCSLKPENMKSFFKYLLATVIGMLIVSLIMFFVTIGTIGAMFASSGSSTTKPVKDNSILRIDLDKTIADKTQESNFDNFDFMNPTDFSSAMGLNDYIKGIRAAKDDDRIKGIYLHYDGAGIGFATTQELREALADFKESGKFVYAFADGYTQSAYHLASAADSVFLQPQGAIAFQGLSAQIMFYTKFFEKVGIEMQVIRHGQFKSAVEPYFRTDMSEANRKQYSVMFNSMWKEVVADVSEARHLSPARINEIADSLLGFTASGSLRSGLVDALVAQSYVEGKFLPSRLGLSDTVDNASHFVKFSDYVADVKTEESLKTLKTKDKIAVLYAEGNIVVGEGSSTSIGTDLASQIKKILKDKDVKALVLRVNSPGGAVLTADIIYQEMLNAKSKMPVVASYGNYAASGGYYISCLADKIIAQPNTLTGSIGVFGTIPSAEGLLTDKLGFTFDHVGTNKNSTAFSSLARPMTSYEEAVMQQSIEEIYAGFVGKVAEGRDMSFEEVDEIGQGRVWSGTNALEIGLVDELGGLDDAIASAAEMAGLDNYKVEEYPKAKDLTTQLLEMFSEMEARSARSHIAKYFGAAGLEAMSGLESILSAEGPQVWARLPYILEFN